MTIKSGIPIAQSGLVTKEDERNLQALSISTVEELLSTITVFPRQIAKLLAHTSIENIMLADARQKRYRVTKDIAKSTFQRTHATGAQPPEPAASKRKASLYLEDVTRHPGATSSKPKVLFSTCIGSVRDQGERGTCVAHSVVIMQEYLECRNGHVNPDLSEQFLYWLCKLNDYKPKESGTWLRIAVPLVVRHGICVEKLWPYDPHKITDNESQGPPPTSSTVLFRDAGKHKSVSATVINPRSPKEITKQLDSGRPVAISVPVYDNWWIYSVEQEGHFPMPLPGSLPVGGHAMCVVGYGYSSEFLGGGYFIVRNSWGTKWAPYSPFSPGYGTLPFSYISRYGWEAFTLSGPPPISK